MKIANYQVGLDQPLLLIAGPCVIESEAGAYGIAETLVRMTENMNLNFVFKASYDKANRSSTSSYRGPGVEEGMRILQRIRDDFNIPVLTDVHEDTPLDEVSEVVDVMQTPAFLVRQTNFIQNVARYKMPINVKKGQFQAPSDINNVVDKCREVGNETIMVCERGVSFGYNTLVSDMRGLAQMRSTHCPVIFDATHSVQQPGGQGATSGGQREFVPVLARSAVAAGISGLFMETHPDPENALSDGPNMLPIDKLAPLLETLISINSATKAQPFTEDSL